MSDNYSSGKLSEAELADLKLRLDNARRRQLKLPPVVVAKPLTYEEQVEIEHCRNIVRKQIEFELNAANFWKLPAA